MLEAPRSAVNLLLAEIKYNENTAGSLSIIVGKLKDGDAVEKLSGFTHASKVS